MVVSLISFIGASNSVEYKKVEIPILPGEFIGTHQKAIIDITKKNFIP
tara:strand:- start:19217 stop:19360 length:144 start_codon:yes stop_codon:yes gene_type:complete